MRNKATGAAIRVGAMGGRGKPQIAPAEFHRPRSCVRPRHCAVRPRPLVLLLSEDTDTVKCKLLCVPPLQHSAALASTTSWRERGAGKRCQPLKGQGVPQQQGCGNEKADDNPLRKCSRPEQRSVKALTSHLKRLATAPISHSRNHSSGLSVSGHRNMMLESDKLTIKS